MMRAALILAAATTTAVTPLSWKKTTRDAELNLTLPAAVRHVPVLANRLYRGEIKGLEKFGAQAGDPKEGRASEPAAFRSQGRWEMQVTYSADLETPRLISLFREEYTDTHGAHPNHQSGGVVFDKATNRNLHPLDLLTPGADLAPLDRALCTAARAAKRERQGADWNEKQDSNFHCPTWRGVPFEKGKMYEGSSPPQIALAKGAAPSQAAGLMFLYSPYDIGAYAEGPYDVIVPFTAFLRALKPEYVAQFAGAPSPDRRLDE